MGFTTNLFLFLFLPAFLLLFAIMDAKYRPYWLLLVSVLFYIWNTPRSILILLASVLVNYLLGRLLLSVGNTGKKIFLTMGVLFSLGLLVYFKYMNFFLETAERFTHTRLQLPDILVPIGISYFTFSAISYLTDIYRGKVLPERNFLKFALYMMMFQKITAGPIIRYADISHQLDCRGCEGTKSAEGARRFCVGLAKKVLLADQLGMVADEIFNLAPQQHLTSVAWLGMICYTLQIYHDFSGYSDMAIGLGKICGFDFPENFNYPYISKSLTEFWRRWHISLSSWFRDYLYIPLGGNRRGNTYVNLSIVFLATGLWHGASWHFVAWGIWNGVFLLAEKFLMKHVRWKLPTVIKVPYTLLVVALGWVLFRCPSLNTALHYFLRLVGQDGVVSGFTLQWYLSPKLLALLLIAMLACIPWRQYCKALNRLRDTILADALYLVLLAVSIAAVMSSTYSSFIYFKF